MKNFLKQNEKFILHIIYNFAAVKENKTLKQHSERKQKNISIH